MVKLSHLLTEIKVQHETDMLHRSIECRQFRDECRRLGDFGEAWWQREASLIVFSNARLDEPISGEFFCMAPTGKVGAAYAYVLTMSVHSPPPNPGVAPTPAEPALTDLCALVSGILDIELSQDLDRCLSLVSGTNPRRPGELVARRFAPSLTIAAQEAEQAGRAVDDITSAADDHLRLCVRAYEAYGKAMIALAEGELALAYSLLVFVLECLAQSEPKPDRATWADFHPAQREKLDRLFKKNSEALPTGFAEDVRNILCTMEHLRVSQKFVDYVVRMLPVDFYLAENVAGIRAPIRRSALEQLLRNAYAARSGYVHALSPISSLIQGHAAGEVFALRDGRPLFTFRGLHRVVRAVLQSFVTTRHRTLDEIERPDLPNVMLARWSPNDWIHHNLPDSDGKNARVWAVGAMEVMLSTPGREELTDRERTTMARLRTWAQDVRDTLSGDTLSVVHGLEVICGGEFQPECCKTTIDTVASDVFANGRISAKIDAAEKAMRRYLNERVTDFLLPQRLEIAIMVALARCRHEQGLSDAYEYWACLAFMDSGFDSELQRRLERYSEGPAEMPVPNMICAPRR